MYLTITLKMVTETTKGVELCEGCGESGKSVGNEDRDQREGYQWWKRQ